MLFYLLKNSLLGIILGNIYGLIQNITKPQKPIWVSKPFVQSLFSSRSTSKGEKFFIIAWVSSVTIIIIIVTNYRDFSSIFEIILTRIFAAMFLILLLPIYNFILNNYLNQLHFFNDRIEIKLGWYTRQIIPFASVLTIRRDQDSHQYAHIIYQKSPSSGNQSLGFTWKIPTEIFKNPQLQIPHYKLNSNLFLPYNEIKDSLPSTNTNKTKKTSSPPATPTDKLKLISIAFFNPIVIFLISPIRVEMNQYSILWFIAMDLSIANVNSIWTSWTENTNTVEL